MGLNFFLNGFLCSVRNIWTNNACVCLFIFVYFLPNSHFLLLLFWETVPYSTKWAGVGKAEPGASHTSKQNWELHKGRGPHAQSPVPRTSLERCRPGGLQGRVWDKGDGEMTAGEPTVRNENRDSWQEWVGRAGHRLGQRGQWSHLTQYWSREGSVIISETETPELRRWRGGRNGQACCPKWYPVTSFLKIFNPPAPREWNPSYMGWFGGLSDPGPLTSPSTTPRITDTPVTPFACAVPTAWQAFPVLHFEILLIRKEPAPILSVPRCFLLILEVRTLVSSPEVDALHLAINSGEAWPRALSTLLLSLWMWLALPSVSTLS